jgi:predicted nucleotidyltransferase
LPSLVTITDRDQVIVGTGEIFTVYGTYKGEICRGRLTYIPNSQGEKLIDGHRYDKVKLQYGYDIPNLIKVVEVPGEEQFLIPRDVINRHYSPLEIEVELDNTEYAVFTKICNAINGNITARVKHGLYGSSLFNSRGLDSDFDWIIYGNMVDFNVIREFITKSPDLIKYMYVDIQRGIKKLSWYTGLEESDILRLYEHRSWRYARVDSIDVSFHFVDPEFLCDDLLKMNHSGKTMNLSGVVKNDLCSNCTPRILGVQTKGGIDYQVLSWLHSYTGAFTSGDLVEIQGEEVLVNNEVLVLVESINHFIKLSN